MTTISSDQVGLRDAADIFGVSIDTLRRRIRDNQMDEALLVQGPFGATWVLPRASISAIAEREGWEPVVPDPTAESSSVGEVEVAGRVSQTVPSASEHEPGVDGATTQERFSGSVMPDSVASGEKLIDLRESTAPPPPPPSSKPGEGAPGEGGVVVTAPPTVAPPSVEAEAGLVRQIQAAIAGEVRSALSDNVEAELTRVREAITSAEVRAVAAEARTDAMRSEQGRLAAQLKRAEADAEYWRSQHDRLDRELDRERTGRVTAEKARAVAETRSSELTRAGDQLRQDLSSAQEREREVLRRETETQAQLDQARMAMGWWSRRRLQRLGQRSEGGAGE